MLRLSLLIGIFGFVHPMWANDPESLADVSEMETKVVVLPFEKGSALATSGLQPGDEIVNWRGPDPWNKESGEQEAIYDWNWFRMYQAASGKAVVTLKRKGELIEWSPQSTIQGAYRPVMQGENLKAFLSGWEEIRTGSLEKGCAIWMNLVKKMPTSSLRCWLLMEIGTRWRLAGKYEDALAYYQKARSFARSPMEKAGLLWPQASCYSKLGQYEKAIDSYKHVLALIEYQWPQGIPSGMTLRHMAHNAIRIEKLEDTLAYSEQAIVILKEKSPKSYDLMGALLTHANGLFRKGKFKEAFAAFTRVEKFIKANPRFKAQLPYMRASLSLLNIELGMLDKGEAGLKEALVFFEKNHPESLGFASALQNIALVSHHRGFLSEEEAYRLRAKELLERIAPKSINMTRCLQRLGSFYFKSKNLKLAEDYLKQALVLGEELLPQGWTTASILHNLGCLAHMKGQLQTSRMYFKRAIKIQEREGARTVSWAETSVMLGKVLAELNQPDQAITYLERALELENKIGGTRPGMVFALNTLGRLMEDKGDPTAANVYRKQAMVHLQKTGTETWRATETYYHWGKIARDRGDFETAVLDFQKAVKALQSQTFELKGQHLSQAFYRGSYADVYRDYVDLLAQLGHMEAAFIILEEFRAHSFKTMLRKRGPMLNEDIPDELKQAHRTIQTKLQQIQIHMNDTQDHQKLEELFRKQRRLLKSWENSTAEIRKIHQASQKVVYIGVPKFRELRDSLNPGDLVLSFLIGEKQSHLFTLSKKNGLRHYPISASRDSLANKMTRLRGLVQAYHSPTARVRLKALSVELFKELLGGAAEEIASANHLVILPDGPLYYLPFGMLRVDQATQVRVNSRLSLGVDEGHLLAWKPLTTAVSLTVHQALAKDPKKENPTLVAFGDPVLAVDARRNLLKKNLRTRSFNPTIWEPLPYAKEEVLNLKDLFKDKAKVFWGKDANEANVRRFSPEADVLHFACHAIRDELSPLHSGLVLSMSDEPGQETDPGVLQTWEIMQDFSLKADLVVLSACETGLGKMVEGDGTLGLTQAFHFAGARTLLASYWKVADETTAKLMVEFYRQYQVGKPKAEALRQAQMMLMRGVPLEASSKDKPIDSSHPFFWAGFQLHGPGD